MRKILVGLIACAILLAMTGVVSAACGDYCKVTGGGTLNDCCTGNFITVSFTAQGPCGSCCEMMDSKVKGMVNIVNHDTKEKEKFAIESICCCDYGCFTYVELNLDNNCFLRICDYGEGSKANSPDWVHFDGNGNDQQSFCGYLSGNAQVKVQV